MGHRAREMKANKLFPTSRRFKRSAYVSNMGQASRRYLRKNGSA